LIMVSQAGFLNANFTNLIFKSFSVQDGLPENTILDIEQDSVGYLWLATENGLSRYDGSNFNNYYFSHEDPFSIPSNFLFDIHVDAHGGIWIGTAGGICKYNPLQDNFRRIGIPASPLKGSTDLYIRSIDEASDGTIYFLLESGFLFRIRSDTVSMVLNLQQGACKFMMIDERDQCWIASKNQIYRYNIGSNLTTQYLINLPSGEKDPEINDMVVTDSILYITGYRSDLIAFNYQSRVVTNCEVLPRDAEPNTTCIHKEGDFILVGTFNHGFVAYDLKSGRLIRYQEDIGNAMSINSNAIIEFFRDRYGNLWLGTADGGLNVAYFNIGFTAYAEDNGNFPKNVTVQAIQKDSYDRLWLGYSSTGIDIYYPGGKKVSSINQIEGLVPNHHLGSVFCFHPDKKGNMWIATYSNGVLKYHMESGKISQYYPGFGDGYSIDGQDIRCINSDAEGNIWIAIHHVGINVKPCDSDRFISLREFDPDIPEVLNQRWIFDIEFDNSGNMWLASTSGAFCYNFETGEYRHYGKDEPDQYKLPDNSIMSITVDSRDDVWLAGFHGINVIKQDLGNISITRDQGLPINKVMAVLEDRNQNIWVSTRYGVSKIVWHSNNDFSIINYNKEHGLHSDIFWANSAFSNGEQIYFGGKKGYTVLHPLQIMKDTVPPKVVLTDMYLFDRKVEIDPGLAGKRGKGFFLEKHLSYCEGLRINARNNSIGIGFSSLKFTSFQNQYKYKLEGFNSEWVSLGDRNTIYFTNLGTGHYVLRIKGANADGTWNNASTDLNITIVPPFLRSRFAIGVYILFILLVFLYLLKLTVEKARMQLVVRHENEVRELRTRFFMNISHELRTPLTLIAVPLKQIVQDFQSKQKTPNLRELSMIYRNVTRIMHIIDQIFDFRRIELNKMEMKVEKANLVDFTESIIDYYDYQIQQKCIRLGTCFEERDLSFYFDPDKMDKIIFNLLSNAIKYTPDNGTIDITVRKSTMSTGRNSLKPCIEWTIKDSGKGIPREKLAGIYDRFPQDGFGREDKRGTGIGLSIVKEFTEMHKGVISIESHAGGNSDEQTYTLVRLLFPIDDEMYSKNQKASQGNVKTLMDEYRLVRSISVESDWEEEAGQPEISKSSEQAYSILVVDDESDMCDLIENALSQFYYVYKANDGKAGLQKAIKYQPDIIISDIVMPEMDGYDFCKIIKSKVETSHIPVLLLTAKTTTDDEIAAYTTGADAFITKPFDINLLKNRVDGLIDNRQKLRRSFLSDFGIKLEKVVPSQMDEKFMKKLIQLINENIAEKDLNVQKITREMGISRSQLYIKVKSVANTSVNLLIRSIRMRRAAMLLASGGMNVSEAAYAVGFDNLPYFSKCFHEEFGQSPSSYASSHKIRQPHS